MIALRFTLGGRNNKPLVVVASAKRKVDKWLRANEFRPEHEIWFDEEGNIFQSSNEGGDRNRPQAADVVLW